MLPALLEDLKKGGELYLHGIFIIDEGIMWGEILTILEEKAKAGLDVRVMFDGWMRWLPCPTIILSDYTRLALKPRPSHQSNPFYQPDYRDHRKITVIDGQVAYTGGVIADEYVNKRERLVIGRHSPSFRWFSSSNALFWPCGQWLE